MTSINISREPLPFNVTSSLSKVVVTIKAQRDKSFSQCAQFVYINFSFPRASRTMSFQFPIATQLNNLQKGSTDSLGSTVSRVSDQSEKWSLSANNTRWDEGHTIGATPGVSMIGPGLQFPWRLHEIIYIAEVEGKGNILSWMANGRAFRVHDREVKILTRCLV